MKLEEYILSKLEQLSVPTTHLGKSVVGAIIDGYRAHNWNATTFRKFTIKHFPDKPEKVYLRSYIPELYRDKYCSECGEVKSLEEFYKNQGNRLGVNSHCKPCQYSATKKTQPARSAQYRSSLENKTPAWADLEAIKEFYKNCPEDMQVDHIIPLNGVNINGLHVLENLQYLSKTDNLVKSNKY